MVNLRKSQGIDDKMRIFRILKKLQITISIVLYDSRIFERNLRRGFKEI